MYRQKPAGGGGGSLGVQGRRVTGVQTLCSAPWPPEGGRRRRAQASVPAPSRRCVQELTDLAERLLEEDGVVTCVYGIGTAFEENVLQGVATHGGGRYAFVDETRIGTAMSEAVTDLLTTVGTNARITLEVSCPRFTAEYTPPPFATAPSPARLTPGAVKQDKSSGGSVDTTKTRSDPQRVRMSSGERPIGAAKGEQSDTEALCQPPPPFCPSNTWLWFRQFLRRWFWRCVFRFVRLCAMCFLIPWF